jgi:hypothetical protein
MDSSLAPKIAEVSFSSSPSNLNFSPIFYGESKNELS